MKPNNMKVVKRGKNLKMIKTKRNKKKVWKRIEKNTKLPKVKESSSRRRN
jgi:hypothetical protein